MCKLVQLNVSKILKLFLCISSLLINIARSYSHEWIKMFLTDQATNDDHLIVQTKVKKPQHQVLVPPTQVRT